MRVNIDTSRFTEISLTPVNLTKKGGNPEDDHGTSNKTDNAEGSTPSKIVFCPSPTPSPVVDNLTIFENNYPSYTHEESVKNTCNHMRRNIVDFLLNPSVKDKIVV